MNDPILLSEAESGLRPRGFVRPVHEGAVRALAAIQDGRLADAEKHVAALPDSPPEDRAWKLYLGGWIDIEQRDFATAEERLSRGAATASVWAWSVEDGPLVDALRLLALCLEKTGWIYRRWERAEDAAATHLAAFRLRSVYGSMDERWESAVSLGLDAVVARRHSDAEAWFRTAADCAAQAIEQPDRRQATAWSHLTVLLTDIGRHDEAVSAARTARDFWRTHDLGAVTAAKADLALGHVLLKNAESLYAGDPGRTRVILHEARRWLATAYESLLAFGPEDDAEARECQEQLDFAERLLASLEG